MNTINWIGMNDNQVVEELGKRIQQLRLNKNLTQTQLARNAGVGRSTISQLENGRAATILTFVQVLRALNELDFLNNLVQEPQISPLQYAKLKGKERKRASGKKQYPTQEDSEW